MTQSVGTPAASELAVSKPAVARWLAVWAFALFGTWATCTGFTALVDPYALIGTPTIRGINEQKFEMSEFGRTSKLREVARRRPQAVILGNSQAEGGLRTATVARLTGQDTYNLSFLGARIEETAVAFEYAVRVAPIRTAILALDYSAFEDGAEHAALFRERTERRLSRELRDFFELTASLQGIAAAIRSATLNALGRQPSHDLDGNWSVHQSIPINDNATPVAALPPTEGAYRAFERICQVAAQREIRLLLIATPVHRTFGLNSADRAAWLARLRTISTAYRLPIVDEGNDDAFNADNHNFFDRGHFTPEAGDRFLVRLFNSTVPAGAQ